MPQVNDNPASFAAALYRCAARASSRMLIRSPDVESVLLHRSAATGEVDFGRSDIDMLMIISEAAVQSGSRLAALLELVRRARRFNPALKHIDVCDHRVLVSHHAGDTFRASLERRTAMLLAGKPVAIPDLPVDRDHGLAKFLVWLEVFFAAAIQLRNRRNIRKLALECWNAYACAAGSDHPPSLLRSDMEARARKAEPDLDVRRLRDPAYAARFVFELAQRLHDERLPPLRKLTGHLTVDSVIAPLCARRPLVVLTGTETELPSDVHLPGAFPCTPEVLNLFVHTKNAFYYWSLPQELLDLGIEPPTAAQFSETCHYYVHERFLLFPGFLVENPPMQAVRLALISRAGDALKRGELPAPGPELGELAPDAPTVLDYYRNRYDAMLRETRRVADALPAGAAAVS